ncbi:MAG: hypothetical protein MJZ05_08240 [Fibrobacter sp.]|nr:hypothetical protein [Fibrobacter sp.]
MDIKSFFKGFLLSTALLTASAGAEGFDVNVLDVHRYGPNLSASIMGNTPFVWGQWLPQAFGEVHYSWLEPMDQLTYGDAPKKAASYWRLYAAAELSPFFGGYKLGLGIRPFRSRWLFELNATYESFLYFRSNVEMVTAEVAGSGEIARTWNADHITDNVWKDDSKWDYAQQIDFGVSFGYYFAQGSVLGFNLHYLLTDISTDFDGKSYDFELNMPVFSRDFIIVMECFGRVPVSEHLAFVFESIYYRTGYLRSKNTVEKESLGYGKAMVGPHVSWDNGLQSVTLQIGGWRRVGKTFYNGSLSQKFLVQFEYQWNFSFPSHRDLSE